MNITGAEAANDRLTVNALGGDDVVDASGLAAGAIQLTADGGEGDGVLIGSAGDDTLLGGDGDDVLLGAPGTDAIDGGPGSNIVIEGLVAEPVTSATVVGESWLTDHVPTVDRKTVIDVGGKQHRLPRADVHTLVRHLS